MGSRPSVACHSGRWVATPNDRDGAICHADVSFGGCSVCRPGMPACAGEWHVATATATLCSTVCSADATQAHFASLWIRSLVRCLKPVAGLTGTDRPACVGTSATPPFARAAAAAARHLHRPSTPASGLGAHLRGGGTVHGRLCERRRCVPLGGKSPAWCPCTADQYREALRNTTGGKKAPESAAECRRAGKQ